MRHMAVEPTNPALSAMRAAIGFRKNAAAAFRSSDHLSKMRAPPVPEMSDEAEDVRFQNGKLGPPRGECLVL